MGIAICIAHHVVTFINSTSEVSVNVIVGVANWFHPFSSLCVSPYSEGGTCGRSRLYWLHQPSCMKEKWQVTQPLQILFLTKPEQHVDRRHRINPRLRSTNKFLKFGNINIRGGGGWQINKNTNFDLIQLWIIYLTIIISLLLFLLPILWDNRNHFPA